MKGIYHSVENFAKEHTLIFGLFLTFGPDGIKFLFDKARGLDYTPLVNYALAFINIDITIKAWHILISLIIISILFLTVSKLKGKLSRKVKELTKKEIKLEGSIAMARHPFNSSISSDFLNSQYGTFCIWAYVTDVHNEVLPNPRFKYIIGYATNGGKTSNNPSLARYPNAWAIQRLTPTKNDYYGAWRFWCNNIDKESTLLDYKKPLSGGWHLFSVSWSTKENYIKFIIDDAVVAEQSYSNWPSDFSSSMCIGTWPTRTPDHFFDSKVGPFKFILSPYDKEIIATLLKTKPELVCWRDLVPAMLSPKLAQVFQRWLVCWQDLCL